jgi:hypothetical protein
LALWPYRLSATATVALRPACAWLCSSKGKSWVASSIAPVVVATAVITPATSSIARWLLKLGVDLPLTLWRTKLASGSVVLR